MEEQSNDTEKLKAELAIVIGEMRDVANATYAVFFKKHMGAHAHAFLEFNGILQKWVDICERAAHQGIDFRHANTHTRAALPIETHDLRYLGEKLGCIFGPALSQLSQKERKEFVDMICRGSS